MGKVSALNQGLYLMRLPRPARAHFPFPARSVSPSPHVDPGARCEPAKLTACSPAAVQAPEARELNWKQLRPLTRAEK